VIFGALLMLGSGVVIVGNKAIFAAATSSISQQNLLGNAGNQAKGHVSINGAKNILLVGLDSRPNQNSTDPIRSDSVMVLHVPADHTSAYLVSIPRDSYVQIPAYSNGKSRYGGGKDKINSAFAFGGQGLTGDDARSHGFELLAQTIKQDLGIAFDAGAIVDFEGFKQVVNVLGGVDMYVDEKVTSIHVGVNTRTGKSQTPFTQDSNLHLHQVSNVKPQVYEVGYQHLAPWQALDYVRQRDLLANGDSDYGRQRHQQQFIKAVFKGILSSGVLKNPGKLAQVLDVVGKAMTIDNGGVGIEDWIFAMRGISANDILTIKTNAGKFNSQNISGLGAVEILDPTSLQLFESIKNDNVANFVSVHTDWVSQSG
jgi:LCP family protein required for cell wall assembly